MGIFTQRILPECRLALRHGRSRISAGEFKGSKPHAGIADETRDPVALAPEPFLIGFLPDIDAVQKNPICVTQRLPQGCFAAVTDQGFHPP